MKQKYLLNQTPPLASFPHGVAEIINGVLAVLVDNERFSSLQCGTFVIDSLSVALSLS